MDGTAIEERARESAARMAQVRLRAYLDGALVLLVTAGAALLAPAVHEALLAASAALSLGVLWYVIRRDRDLVRLAAESRWRDAALAGRGMQLSEWKQGAPLEAWSVRRDEQVQDFG